MSATTPQSAPLDAALQQAVAHHRAGGLQEAEQLYRAILQALPDQPDANHNLGVLAGQVGQHAAGLPFLKTAWAVKPDQGQYALSYAGALLATGQAGEALDVLHAAMRRGFNTPAVQTLRQQAEAAMLDDAMRGNTPTSAEINQLATLFNTGQYTEMERRARLLLERHPDSGVTWKALGVSLQVQGKDALPALQKAAGLLRDDADAHYNLGNALQDAGQFDAAAASYRRALALKPDDADTHSNLGAALQALGQPADAVESYAKALEISPDDAATHNNLGAALQTLGQFDGALASYRRALEIKPDFAEAHNNLGNALKDLDQLDGAMASYRRALEIKSDYADAHSNLLFAYSLTDNASGEMLAEARRYDQRVTRQARPYTAWRNIPAPARRLRVGLVSPDLRNHPVGYFLESLLTHIDPARLELTAYPAHHFDDELTARIKRYFAAWKPLVGLSDETAAGLIYADGIDILIDLSGHTANNRLPLFAWKPAPVQVSWLGYFATTGMTAMDYLIADPWTLPESEEVYFTEKILRLPETRLCFTPPDVAVSVSPLPALTNGYVTFGCFNNLAKMNDDVVALWARVLQATPGSRLFLKTKQLGEATMRQRTIKRF
ncbi:MAG: tetratricopeptide repeat protein, partial [Sulfuricellaceae bacterium]